MLPVIFFPAVKASFYGFIPQKNSENATRGSMGGWGSGLGGDVSSSFASDITM